MTALYTKGRSKNSWSYCYQSPLGIGTRPWRHQQLRTDTLCYESAARSRHVLRRPSRDLPVGRRRQNHLRIQRLVGFSTAADRQRIDAFFRRSKRCGMCPIDLQSFEELCRTADSKLFLKVLSDSSHVLFKLLPPQSVASQNYNLRKRHHNRELKSSKTSLIGRNFVNRMLFTDS